MGKETKTSDFNLKPSSATPTNSFGPWPTSDFGAQALSYWIDSWQRSLLFLDVMRERGNIFIEHEKQGKPPTLVFDYEMVFDGRTLEDPANYALLRIKPSAEHPTDPKKRPIVVIDPRAGHGPGIAGSKMASEIGIAMRAGNPCYFVMFFPKPCPTQTIESIIRAEGAFLEKVGELHPEAEDKPFVIGNCQGGWALLMLAAAAPDLFGPILLAGSPVSYWAGVEGKNPMRYNGGLFGGSWLSSFTSDLGNGTFDGSYLVENFENLNPANTLWTKYYNLYSKIDTECERFLDFEKWWGGYFFLNKKEMEWIVQNLFVGNRLTSNEIRSADGKTTVNLYNVRSPIVVFASWGDNITPPPQALNWIPDLYDSVDEIRAHDQTIVYCLHNEIGHLGIFVSAKVADREHTEMMNAIDIIDALPPGLYEAIIEDTRPDMPSLELTDGRYLIKFEMRTIEDILALGDGREHERPFEVVKRFAEVNQGLYDTFLSPFVRATSSEMTAHWLRMLQPTRMQRYMYSDMNPAMWPLKTFAQIVREQRQPVSPDNAFHKLEKLMSDRITVLLDNYRDLRDTWCERLFKSIYASPWIAAIAGLTEETKRRKGPRPDDWLRNELKRLKALEHESYIERGTPLDGAVRILLYQGRDTKVVDERPARLIQRFISEAPSDVRPTFDQLKQAFKRQLFILLLDEEKAVNTLPKLLPEMELRRKALELVRRIATASDGKLNDSQKKRFRRIEEILGIATEGDTGTQKETRRTAKM
ncbi:MAG: TerB family tellurite resistance protein [Syntrophobacteraceae bacterium]